MDEPNPEKIPVNPVNEQSTVADYEASNRPQKNSIETIVQGYKVHVRGSQAPISTKASLLIILSVLAVFVVAFVIGFFLFKDSWRDML